MLQEDKVPEDNSSLDQAVDHQATLAADHLDQATQAADQDLATQADQDQAAQAADLVRPEMRAVRREITKSQRPLLVTPLLRLTRMTIFTKDTRARVPMTTENAFQLGLNNTKNEFKKEFASNFIKK